MKGLVNLKSLHGYSIHNRELVQRADMCGCFCCNAEFRSHAIFEWLDNDSTAVCPFCSIDSVLPDNLGIDLTQELLQEMGDYWFDIKEHRKDPDMGRVLVRDTTESQDQEQG